MAKSYTAAWRKLHPQNLVLWMIGKAGHPQAKWWLFILSIIEALFFPIPVDLLLVPMVLANKHKAFAYAGIAIFGSCLGGALAWAIGYFAYENLATYIIAQLSLQTEVTAFINFNRTHGDIIILAGAITPLPFKVIALTSGFSGINFFTFLGLSLLGRGIRFYILSIVVYFAADKIRWLILRHFYLLMLGVLLFLVLIIWLTNNWYAII